MRNIEAITFDVGGTLIEPRPSVGHIYARIAARNGAKGISPSLLNSRFAKAWKARKRFRYTRSDWAELVDETFGRLLSNLPNETFFDELYEYFTRRGAWHLYPDVIPTLKALRKRGVKLGIISNWDDRLPPLLRVLKLHSRFDAIVVSCETGCVKPARRIFRAAAKELKLPPQNILHVGDSFDLDVRGARAAGMQAVLLRRDSLARQNQIASLSELISKIYL
jgi:putative hydrolase of the HAD superfamily